MQVRPIDPRSVTEVHSVSAYHVYFWNDGRSAAEEYEVTEAVSVREVVRWADHDPQSRAYELFALTRTDVAVQLVTVPDTFRTS